MARDEPLAVLVVGDFDGSDATAIADFLFAFHAHSRHRISFVLDSRRLGSEVDLDRFDAVVLFWSTPLVGSRVGPALRARLAGTRAFKTVFLQDEYQDVDRRVERLDEIGAQLVYTCVAEGDREAFYPSRRLPRLVALRTALPGYVPARLAARPFPGPEPERAVDLGYRSRVPPFSLGDLARHKVRAPERVGAACRAAGLAIDLSARELDRLYGAAWRRFLARSRCVLGSPSGASVIDFDGRLRRACERHRVLHPEAGYEEVHARLLAAHEGRLAIDTVSARVFEAAAMGCTLVQVAGRYGDVLEAQRHYIAIAPDYGNLDEVVQRVRDRRHCREVAAAAHRDLVASGRYGFPAFVAAFDAELDRQVPARRGTAGSPSLFHLARALRGRQSHLPAGDGAVALLRPLTLATSALRRLPVDRLPAGPLLGRVLRNPQTTRDKLALLARLLARERAARTLVLLRRRAGVAVPAWQLLEDLLKLGVAAAAHRGTLESTEPFAVDLVVEPGVDLLWLVSRPPSVAPARGALAALPATTPARLAWDHTGVGTEVTLVRGRRPFTLSVGEAGIHDFAALTSLARASSSAGPAVLALLASHLIPDPA